jgi:hypothetical protein
MFKCTTTMVCIKTNYCAGDNFDHQTSFFHLHNGGYKDTSTVSLVSTPNHKHRFMGSYTRAKYQKQFLMDFCYWDRR